MTAFNELYKEMLSKVEYRMYETIPDKTPKSLYEPFKYLVSAGGKRIRPVLTMISAGAVGGNPEDALDSAVALEIMHNFTLVHDDIMDESPLRRGRETVHLKWNSAVAILTGDIMVGYAYKLLPSSSDHKRADEIQSLMTNGLIEVCEGQAFDMDFNTSKSVSFDDYISMISKKTAKLLETSVLIGSHCALANYNELQAMSNYALNLGLAFQIQDDLLDITADQEKLGKTIGLDIVEGKKTCLIIKALERAENESDNKLLEDYYRNNGAPIEEVQRFREMFERLGILEFAREKTNYYSSIAANELKKIPNNQYVEMLDWLQNYLLNRKH